MPLKKKLKENEFYCVGVRKKCALKPEDICLTTWKNGASALVGNCEKFNCTANKIVKQSKVDRLEKKYGRCRKSPKRKSKSRRKSTKRKSPKRKSKSRRKSTKRKSPKRKSKSRRKSTKRKSPKRKSKSRRKSTKRKSPKRKSKSRRKSTKRKCKYGVKKSGGCKKKPGRKKN